MSRVIQHIEEPMDVKVILDFLSYPAELARKKENTKVTTSLSSESMRSSKQQRNHMQY